MFIFFPYVIVLFISFSMAVFASAYAHRFRNNMGVKEFIFASSASAWWILCQCLELMATSFIIKYIFSCLLYIGAGLSAFAYLATALRFTDKGHLLNKRNVIIVLSIYAVFFFFIFTDIKFGIMRTNFGMDTSSIPYVITKDYSVFYPVYTAFVQLMNVISLVVLLREFIKGNTLYRKQTGILFSALFIIALFNVAYVTKVFGQLRFDLTPAIFGVASIVIFFGIFRHKLLDVIPVSRNMLVDTMDSGLLVLDKNGKIVDVNYTFEEIFDIDEKSIIGKNITDIAALKNVFSEKRAERFEIDHNDRHLIIKTNLLHKYGFNAGTMYIVDDITEQYRNSREMMKQQATISIMNERERLGRDLHDSFGQIFGYMNIQAQTVKEYLAQENINEADKKLNELIKVAKQSHEDIRAFILQMKGSNLKNRNFRVALSQYLDDIRQRFNMDIGVEFDEDLPKGFPDDEKAVQIIKIIAEALNNVRNHAGECRADIRFLNVQGDTEVLICDNGKGFNTNTIGSTSGYGLSIMQERAKEAEGHIFVESEKGAGTTVKLVFAKGDSSI